MNGNPAGGSDFDGFRTLCETCGVGFWHIDAGGRTVYLNPVMCELLEVRSVEELAGWTYHRFFTEDSLARMGVEHAKRPNGIPSTYEAELIGMRGGRRAVVISGAPLTDQEGRLEGLIGTFTDITARKQAERERAESETRLRSLFTASIDAIGVACEGRITMMNPAGLRMFGYDGESDVLGRPILTIIAPGDRERVGEYIRQGLEHPNAVFHYRCHGCRRNSETFPMEVHVSEYREQGKTYRMAIMHELTAQLHLEEQLRQAQKMDALGRLSGGIAHDFNNLLMVMLGCAEMILAKPNHADVASTNAGLIRATGERAVALTRQLLALSRRQVVEPRVIDLQAVVEETVQMLGRLLGPGVELAVNASRSALPIRADFAHVQQVLMNLCLNARDALGETGRITISASVVAMNTQDAQAAGVSPGNYARLEVSDTGAGMDEETRQRAFEPFFTTKTRGTGLGLSTVYGIVKQSGGHVAVRSAPGHGTTVSVDLPLADAPLSKPAPEPKPLAPTHTGTVLIVDDELSVREVVQRFLESLGYHILTASDGREALQRFELHGAIDAVITDVLMPGMGGVELAKALDRIRPNVPLLFMSGYARDESTELLAGRSQAAFLLKPFSLADLSRQLEHLLGSRERFSGRSP